MNTKNKIPVKSLKRQFVYEKCLEYPKYYISLTSKLEYFNFQLSIRKILKQIQSYLQTSKATQHKINFNKIEKSHYMKLRFIRKLLK